MDTIIADSIKVMICIQLPRRSLMTFAREPGGDLEVVARAEGRTRAKNWPPGEKDPPYVSVEAACAFLRSHGFGK